MNFLKPNQIRIYTSGSAIDSSAGGISVIELLCAVTVIVVVMAIAVPSISKQLDIYRLDTSASLIAGKMREARMNAIKRNRQTWLALDASARTLKVQTTDASNPSVTVNLGQQEFLPLRIGFSGNPPSQISFDSMGRPLATQTIILTGTNSGSQKTITVSAAGRITLN